MRIVHVVDPFAGGIATFLKLLTEELKDHQHTIIHGERNSLADYQEVRTIFDKNNVHFIHWKSVQRKVNLFKDVTAYLELKKILSNFKNVDAIHLHSSKAGFLGRLVCMQLGIKNVIYTPNGAPFLMKSVGRTKLTIFEKLEKIGNRFGGRVICSSASECKEYLKRDIQAKYIHNGTRINKHSFISNKNYNKFRIVTCGRLADQKNPELFNQIAQSLSDLKQFEFIWIGGGEHITDLTAQNISITGWLSTEGVKQEIAKADLYLSTSFFEGLPFAVMEAMSFGKCLLLSNCTGNVDLVKKGINGEIFDTKEEALNHIIYFYLNREITASMGLSSLEVCRDYFNIEETALLYLQEYRKTFTETIHKKSMSLSPDEVEELRGTTQPG